MLALPTIEFPASQQEAVTECAGVVSRICEMLAARVEVTDAGWAEFNAAANNLGFHHDQLQWREHLSDELAAEHAPDALSDLLADPAETRLRAIIDSDADVESKGPRIISGQADCERLTWHRPAERNPAGGFLKM